MKAIFSIYHTLRLLTLKTNHVKNLKFIETLMDEHIYLASLNNKEFLILKKLCNNSISQIDKEKSEKELKQTRLDIEKLGWVLFTNICKIQRNVIYFNFKNENRIRRLNMPK